jgi:bis(5'-nucleosyl)-tetraphosphatase (symmetrical)
MDDRPILFLGDIQGCARELELLLERAGFRPGAHRLVPLGDTINRGPDAAGVLALLAEARAEPILGNHELGLLEIARDGRRAAWAQRPDYACVQLRAAGRWDAEMAAIARWPLVREGPGWIAVHAGLHPLHPPADTEAGFLTGVRWCDAEGRLPPCRAGYRGGNPAAPPPGFRPWWEFYRGERSVLFGHWAQRGLVREGRVWGLDTGCVYGRALTGLWWPQQRLVQVPALQAYHPVGSASRPRQDVTGGAPR